MKCRLCIGKYHYQCLSIEKLKFSTLTKEQTLNWICPSCSNVTRRTQSHDSTPVRGGQLAPTCDETLGMSCDMIPPESLSTVAYSHEEVSKPNSITNTSEAVTMEKISALFDQKLNSSFTVFMENFRQVLRNDVKEMIASEMGNAIMTIKDEFSATTDFICQEQHELRSNINNSIATIKVLEDENNRLQCEIVKLNARLAGIEKVSRSCNIEIQAVPERKNENVLLLLKKLCELVKVPIDDANINACRRVAKLNTSSSRPRNIVVTFSSPRIRDLVLSATHRFNRAHPDRGLTSSDLEIPGESSRVFVTEHLSPEQKTLHAAVRGFARDRGFKYVWIKYGQVYIRKDDSAGAVLIRNRDFLEKL
ncbi:unnamed protein product [Arctia plantaginis]|uniref:FP protein C-terminal domain-containing protein n=1 Tax=Arctia plantaginis TaxID=874455 RepID=A0A8S0ZWK4_ARCPL|nr:unnamed protein product [Arctia plantaginis]